MITTTLNRSFDITISTYQVAAITPAVEGCIIFLTGLWLVGWVVVLSIIIKRYLKFRKSPFLSIVDEKMKKCQSLFKWYFRTWLNKAVLTLWVLIAMLAFGGWWA